jgi:hypothetical protein
VELVHCERERELARWREPLVHLGGSLLASGLESITLELTLVMLPKPTGFSW